MTDDPRDVQRHLHEQLERLEREVSALRRSNRALRTVAEQAAKRAAAAEASARRAWQLGAWNVGMRRT